ncbi:hypothetical protein TWF506_002911 [Arthrobotrys conoides]|uniref:Uncharacterized protein n=1 Tax=Arthrobotrys conoides TaxID=74498 RepID=A0AAN8N862_9PEZI
MNGTQLQEVSMHYARVFEPLLLCTMRIRKAKASTRKEKGGQSTLNVDIDNQSILSFVLLSHALPRPPSWLCFRQNGKSRQKRDADMRKDAASCTDSSNPVRPCGKASEVSWGLPHHEARTNIASCKKNRKFASRDAFMLRLPYHPSTFHQTMTRRLECFPHIAFWKRVFLCENLPIDDSEG